METHDHASAGWIPRRLDRGRRDARAMRSRCLRRRIASSAIHALVPARGPPFYR